MPCMKKYVQGTGGNATVDGLMIWADDTSDGETVTSLLTLLE